VDGGEPEKDYTIKEFYKVLPSTCTITPGIKKLARIAA
jgi:hypothetical protein